MKINRSNSNILTFYNISSTLFWGGTAARVLDTAARKNVSKYNRRCFAVIFLSFFIKNFMFFIYIIDKSSGNVRKFVL